MSVLRFQERISPFGVHKLSTLLVAPMDVPLHKCCLAIKTGKDQYSHVYVLEQSLLFLTFMTVLIHLDAFFEHQCLAPPSWHDAFYSMSLGHLHPGNKHFVKSCSV